MINDDSDITLIPLEKDVKWLLILMASDIYVYDDQGIIGYGAHDGPEITALYVHPKHRGRGVGITLLEHLLSKIPHQAYLYVAKLNALAIGVYQKYGLEIVEEFQVIYNGVPVIANILRKAEICYWSGSLSDKKNQIREVRKCQSIL